MKKILIIILLFTFILPYGCVKKKNLSEFDTFIINNNISLHEIEPYFQYKRFIFYDFYSLENLRNKNNYTYLETINYFYVKEGQALLPSTELILVNKSFFLSKNFCPQLINIDDYPVKVTKYNMKIQKQVLLNYINMINDLELFNLYIYSGYRSYERQLEIYDNSTNKNYVAEAGKSEHQTGLVLDVSTLTHGLTNNFQYSFEYQLLYENCEKYGFIIRYPENKQNITGYNFEPWHLRFVGKAAATEIMNNSLTLEQYIYKNFEL